MNYVSQIVIAFASAIAVRCLRKESNGAHPAPRADDRRSHPMRHQSPKRRRGPGRFIIGALVIVVVAAIGVGVYLRTQAGRRLRAAAGPAPSRRRGLPRGVHPRGSRLVLRRGRLQQHHQG